MNTEVKWTRTKIIEVMKTYSPNEALTRRTYASFSETHQGLVPCVVTILGQFKTWDNFRLTIWGIKPIDWTSERVEAALKQHFKKAPTSRELTALASTNPNIPTIHYCAKAFGSYEKMKEVVFKDSVEPEVDESRLIQAMRSQFTTRPRNFRRYHAQAKGIEGLPMAEDYIRHFGSWEKAMLVCYPVKRSRSGRQRMWTEDQILESLRLAQQEVGKPLDARTYYEWSTGREGVPSISTVITYWGKLSIALKMAGLQVEKPRQSRTRKPKVNAG